MLFRSGNQLVAIVNTAAQQAVIFVADNLPPSFPVQEVFQELDYDQISVGEGHQFVLPLKVTVRSRAGKMLSKNEIEFRMYRKFETGSTIKFDTPDPLPEDKTTEQPPK